MRSRVAALLALLASGCTLVFPASSRTAAYGQDAGVVARRDGSLPSHVPVPDLQFCQELVERHCRARLACCGGASESMSQCLSDNFPDCSARLAGLLGDARNAYDADVAGAVLAELDAYVDRSCDIGVAAWARSPEGLARVFEGTFPAGADCDDTALRLACRRPNLCVRSGVVGLERTCGEALAEGAACDSDRSCEASLFCDRRLATARCAPRLAQGGSCSRDGECESGTCMAGACGAQTPESAWCAGPPWQVAFAE